MKFWENHPGPKGSREPKETIPGGTQARVLEPDEAQLTGGPEKLLEDPATLPNSLEVARTCRSSGKRPWSETWSKSSVETRAR